MLQLMALASNPLQDLSPEVTEALKKAGWRPGVLQRRRQRENKSSWRLHEFAQVKQILDELWGIEVQPPDYGRWLGRPVKFDTDLFVNYEEVTALGRRLEVDLCPLAQVDHAHEILLLADSGHTFLISQAASGVYLAGETFAETMNRFWDGVPMRPLLFEDDESDHFRLEDIGPDHPDGVFLRANQGILEALRTTQSAKKS